MNRLIVLSAVLTLQACSSAGWTNEDAGLSLLASDVSVPANGQVVYTIDRRPRTDMDARRWARDNSVSRSYLSWFGLGGPKSSSAGNAANHISK